MKMCLEEFQSSPINLILGDLATIAPGRGETRARMLPDLFPSRYYSTNLDLGKDRKVEKSILKSRILG